MGKWTGRWRGLLLLLVAAVAVAAMLPASATTAPSTSQAEVVSVPGGGWKGSGGGGDGTVGLPWADDKGRVVGHLTVDHLGPPVTPSSHGLPTTLLEGAQQTWDADLRIIKPVAGGTGIIPRIVTSDEKKSYEISDWAREGDITVGQRICHGGWNDGTQKRGGVVCGTVTKVGPTDKCRNNGSGSSTCLVTYTGEGADGFYGGGGDSGSAVWTEQPDGTIKVVGIHKSGNGKKTGFFEPIYAATQLFGGHPLTATHKLSLSAETVDRGTQLTATYQAEEPDATNWIGIYPRDAKPGATAALTWKGAPDKAGTVELDTSNLNPGDYFAYIFEKGGYNSFAKPVPFSVKGGVPTGAGITTCTAPAWNKGGPYQAGATVSHNGRKWTAPHWIGGDREPGRAPIWQDLGPCAA